ncbi:ROK family protein [Nakamurella leprariae]|uniref:ROK family protein n=1 Tax=Nakamurella leprariae TaxID=2803911 RepID=A0A939C352_9ACTN|nr:ROK family protein [Nakamurella leprariae]MBM9469029.1 ROK family protein [Nakamurella leprariae]
MPSAGAVVAIDIGGTTIKGAVVDADGRWQHRDRRPTRRQAGPEQVLTDVLVFADELIGRATALGVPAIGIGVASLGLVDPTAGRLIWSATVGWRDVPLVEILRTRTGLPVMLFHDIAAGALAEAEDGAAQGVPDFLFTAIGTGIGGTVVVDGQPRGGAHHRAGELGHLVVRPGGAPCGCGARGCLETLASGRALTERYTAALGRPATAAELLADVAAGSPLAQPIWDDAVAALADALVAHSVLVDPELIVIGGGVAGAGPLLFEPLRAAVDGRLMLPGAPRLLPAHFGDDAALVGAAAATRRTVTAIEAPA